jgi:transketolase
MSNMDKAFFDEKCKTIRRLIMEGIQSIGAGHVGGCLSCVEALSVLRYKMMQGLDPKDPKREGRDRLVVSKGHAGPTMYAILADQGYFPMDWICTLNKLGTHLPSHTDMNATPGIDMTAGSLGQGIACAVGLAYGSKLKGDGATIYCLVGDGESQEGEVWEAAHIAAGKNLGNLVCMTDYNKLQIDGPVEQVSGLAPLADKWKAFNWNVFEVADGHDTDEIESAVILAKAAGKANGKPSMIILNTIKGKGVSFAEEMGFACHHMQVSAAQLEQAKKEIG